MVVPVGLPTLLAVNSLTSAVDSIQREPGFAGPSVVCPCNPRPKQGAVLIVCATHGIDAVPPCHFNATAKASVLWDFKTHLPFGLTPHSIA